MSNNVIKIKTRKDDYERIYLNSDLKHYTPRTKSNCNGLDWIVSLFQFGSEPKYFVEFTPVTQTNDSRWRFSFLSNLTHICLRDCPRYVQSRYKSLGYDLDSIFYCFEFEG